MNEVKLPKQAEIKITYNHKEYPKLKAKLKKLFKPLGGEYWTEWYDPTHDVITLSFEFVNPED